MDTRQPTVLLREPRLPHALLLLCEALGVCPSVAIPRLDAVSSEIVRGTSSHLSALLDGRMTIPGVGRVRLARLRAALALAEALACETLQATDPVTSPEACERWLKLRLGRAEREYFCCLFLDSGNRVLAFEDLFAGTVDGAVVYPRVIAQRALTYNASAVIAAHNHPSGRLEPSKADLQLTARLKSALALLDIRLLDHLIVGGSGCESLAQLGHC